MWGRMPAKVHFGALFQASEACIASLYRNSAPGGGMDLEGQEETKESEIEKAEEVKHKDVETLVRQFQKRRAAALAFTMTELRF